MKERTSPSTTAFMSRISDKTDEHVGRKLTDIEIAEELLETMFVLFSILLCLTSIL